MSSFQNLYSRVKLIAEAKVSPYAKAHPAFGPITNKMRAGGLSSAPLDTIKFIREILYYMDILDDNEFNTIKRASGFTGKKQAMLAALQAKQDIINQRKDEITARIEDTLDDFINGVGVNRGREEKYAAQAAAQEIAKEMRKVKAGKQLDDALADTITDEKLLVKASLAKVLSEIRINLGNEGFDIEEEALDEVENFVNNINSITQLKSFIKQIATEPGYEKIAAYLSSIVKPVESGLEDNEMVEDEEDAEGYSAKKAHAGRDIGKPGKQFSAIAKSAAKKYHSKEAGARVAGAILKKLRGEGEEEYSAKKADINNNGKVEGWEKAIAKKRGFEHVSDEDAESLEQYDYNENELPDEGLQHIVREFELTPMNLDSYKSERYRVVELFAYDKDGQEAYVGKFADSPKPYFFVSSFGRESFTTAEELANRLEEAITNRELTVEDEETTVTESYTTHYLTEQAQKDKRNCAPKQDTISFKERMKPKTHWQLEELRRYGL